MEKVKISVITVCFNCKKDLEATIYSVASQNYDNIEYIIVDGGSSDGTISVIETNKNSITSYISEPDDGIYDAMNKGIKLSTGDWIVMMNAGDVFASKNTLSSIFSQKIPEHISAIYSDYFLRKKNGKDVLWKTDRSKGIVHHQNIIYRKNLHDKYGLYIVTHPYIVSDLLFMIAIPEQEYMKIPQHIAIVQDGGVSTGNWVYEQFLCVKMIYGICTFPQIIALYLKCKIGLILRKLHLIK